MNVYTWEHNGATPDDKLREPVLRGRLTVRSAGPWSSGDG